MVWTSFQHGILCREKVLFTKYLSKGTTGSMSGVFFFNGKLVWQRMWKQCLGDRAVPIWFTAKAEEYSDQASFIGVHCLKAFTTHCECLFKPFGLNLNPNIKAVIKSEHNKRVKYKMYTMRNESTKHECSSGEGCVKTVSVDCRPTGWIT